MELAPRRTGRLIVRRMALIAIVTAALLGVVARPARALKEPEPAAREAGSDRTLERLRRILLPLLRATNHPERRNQIRVKVVAEPRINAGSAGGGQFLLTTGLLEKANDEQLRGVLAHEIAHDDLGHPVKMQLIGAGFGLGTAILENLFPGSRRVAPIAGTLIASSYSRPQELEADRHAVTLLQRAGYGKDAMIGALTWIMVVEGNGGGGFLSTHPATEERIRALKRR